MKCVSEHGMSYDFPYLLLIVWSKCLWLSSIVRFLYRIVMRRLLEHGSQHQRLTGHTNAKIYNLTVSFWQLFVYRLYPSWIYETRRIAGSVRWRRHAQTLQLKQLNWKCLIGINGNAVTYRDPWVFEDFRCAVALIRFLVQHSHN